MKPLVLAILDGWGVSQDGPGNAISLARKPFWNRISVAYPHTNLLAAGEAVGLPKGEAGNSEVGHLNIGAGMVVYQELPRISISIANGTFIENKAFKQAAASVTSRRKKLHLVGLVGRGGVHSSLEHLYALLWFAKANNIKDVYVHAFTDGRDSSPTSGKEIIQELLSKINQIGVGKIASICGRYYGMDRDNRWERTQKAYDLLVKGSGARFADPVQCVAQSYAKGVTDEFIEPSVVPEADGATHNIEDGDSVIFFNFRPDRARQLTHAFVDNTFNFFQRGEKLKDLEFVTMSEYEKNLPCLVAFPPPTIDYPLAAVVSLHDMKQLHIGETEKYAHVTYFLNGGREEPYPGEQRIHIPSPKVATYDQKPEMSALEITNYVCQRIQEELFEVYIINFANADMVAHTGSLQATVKAIETLDSCLRRISDMILPIDGTMIITGDHGNAESMIDLKTGGPDTEHSDNPVPFIVVSKRFETRSNLELPSGILADVAPTTLSLMGFPVPETMTGKDLLSTFNY